MHSMRPVFYEIIIQAQARGRDARVYEESYAIVKVFFLYPVVKVIAVQYK